MTIAETKEWVAEKLGDTFTLAKEGYLPQKNTANTKAAIRLGFVRVAFRTNIERQWSGNIPARRSFEQLMLRKADSKLFTMTDNILVEWAKRGEGDAEIIKI